MNARVVREESRVRTGQVVAALLGAFVVYVLIVRLHGTGRHFLELGVVRLVLFTALLAFARWSGAATRGLGRAGLVLAAVGAVGYVAGALGAVATDGWSFDVFSAENEGTDPPWYAYVLGLTGIVFALGTLLVGIAGRAAGRLAVVVMVAGASFPLAFALGDTAGHVAWFVPWLVLAVGLSRVEPRTARSG